MAAMMMALQLTEDEAGQLRCEDAAGTDDLFV
jgi:hypothetical protein